MIEVTEQHTTTKSTMPFMLQSNGAFERHISIEYINKVDDPRTA
jgi:hypothetical protein